MNVGAGSLVIIVDPSSPYNGSHGEVVGYVTKLGSPKPGIITGSQDTVNVRLDSGPTVSVSVGQVRPYGESTRPIGTQTTNLRDGSEITYDPSIPFASILQRFGPAFAPVRSYPSAVTWGYDPSQRGRNETVGQLIWRNLQQQQGTPTPHVYVQSWLFGGLYSEGVDVAYQFSPNRYNRPPNIQSIYERINNLAPIGPPFPF